VFEEIRLSSGRDKVECVDCLTTKIRDT
jgi:hypothetical protein